jgi:hypothetical protein
MFSPVAIVVGRERRERLLARAIEVRFEFSALVQLIR